MQEPRTSQRTQPFSAEAPLRICVLVSGGGSTLANLIERIADGRLRNVRIVQVISSRAAVRGVEIARSAGLPIAVIRPKDFDAPGAFAAAMRSALAASNADLVILAGYLTLLPIPPEFHGRVLNIHPALLPGFGGAGMYGPHVHEAVLLAREKQSGCTVHLVDEQFDHGPIIAQAATDVLPDDTPESLATRVMSLERELYPAVLQHIADQGLDWLANPQLDYGDRRDPDRVASGNQSPGPSAKSYACQICGRRIDYAGPLPAIYPFCSSRCRWVDLGRWFQGQYSINEDLPPEELSQE